MSHPTPEELVEFLYAEDAPDRRPEISRHLESCPDCRAQMESWRAVQGELSAWRVPGRTHSTGAASRIPLTTRALGWAAAAAVFMLAGYGLARLTSPSSSIDTAALREQVTQELRGEWQQFAATQAKRQEQYQQALTKTLGELEARRLADHVALRRDVETVAVHAEDELLNTRKGLERLAAAAPQRPLLPQ